MQYELFSFLCRFHIPGSNNDMGLSKSQNTCCFQPYSTCSSCISFPMFYSVEKLLTFHLHFQKDILNVQQNLIMHNCWCVSSFCIYVLGRFLSKSTYCFINLIELDLIVVYIYLQNLFLVSILYLFAVPYLNFFSTFLL